MIDPTEIWQAKVNGEIYEAEFSELVNWIAESSLLESDKVSRRNLRWLEAGKVPSLRTFFDAKANGIPPPELPTTQAKMDPETEFSGSDEYSKSEEYPDGEADIPVAVSQQKEINPDQCSIHPEVASKYVCQACDHPFCKQCPKSYGSTVKICPYCGAMCNEIKALQNERNRSVQYNDDLTAGFGFSDFGKALAYPFQFKASLVFGGLMFAFLSLGKGAASLGGIIMLAAALICVLFANALTFGVLANTIDNFSKGHTTRDFMPSFDEFSLWDDVVHPFFLSIAVYISSFGLFFVLIFGAGWMAWSSFAEQMKNPAPRDVSELSDTNPQIDLRQIQELSKKYKERNEVINRETQDAEGITEEQRISIRQESEFRKLRELGKSGNTDNIENPFTDLKEPNEQMSELQAKAGQAMLLEFVKRAGILLLLAGIAFLWGLLYFPAACAVAGYTRSFWSTLNPLIGLDTIKYLGVDYVKILFMGFLLSIMSGTAMAILGLVFSPFNLGQFGNPPVTFIGSFVTFYFSVAFAVTLGYALYKNAEKLAIYRG